MHALFVPHNMNPIGQSTAATTRETDTHMCNHPDRQTDGQQYENDRREREKEATEHGASNIHQDRESCTGGCSANFLLPKQPLTLFLFLSGPLLAPPAVVNAGGQRSRLLLVTCCDKVHLIHSTEGRPHSPVAHNQNFNRASFETAASAKLVSKQVQCERESAAC